MPFKLYLGGISYYSYPDQNWIVAARLNVKVVWQKLYAVYTLLATGHVQLLNWNSTVCFTLYLNLNFEDKTSTFVSVFKLHILLYIFNNKLVFEKIRCYSTGEKIYIYILYKLYCPYRFFCIMIKITVQSCVSTKPRSTVAKHSIYYYAINLNSNTSYCTASNLKWFYIYSTEYTECQSPLGGRLNWLPPPSTASEDVSPPRIQEAHTRLWEGGGEANSDDGTDTMVLCILIPSLWSIATDV